MIRYFFDVRLFHPLFPVGFHRRTSQDQYGRLTGGHEYVHCVRPSSVPRLLRLFQALFTTLVARGHEVKIGPRSEHSRDRDVLLIVHHQTLLLRVEERLRRKERALTAEEKRSHQGLADWRKRRGEPPPKETKRWNRYPDGELIFRTNTYWQYQGKQSWYDTKRTRLEDQLGTVVLGLEAIGAFQREHELQEQREAAEALAQERARLRGTRMGAYRKRLARDLHRMAEDWKQAETLREFLAQCQRRLPHTTEARAWLEATAVYVERLDPFSAPEVIAKPLEPSDEELERIVTRKDGG